MWVVSGEKPFVCTWQSCEWRFSRSDELSRHLRSHNGIKPYLCKICNKRFSRSDHLSKHIRVHQIISPLSASNNNSPVFDPNSQEPPGLQKNDAFVFNDSQIPANSNQTWKSKTPNVGNQKDPRSRKGLKQRRCNQRETGLEAVKPKRVSSFKSNKAKLDTIGNEVSLPPVSGVPNEMQDSNIWYQDDKPDQDTPGVFAPRVQLTPAPPVTPTNFPQHIQINSGHVSTSPSSFSPSSPFSSSSQNNSSISAQHFSATHLQSSNSYPQITSVTPTKACQDGVHRCQQCFEKLQQKGATVNSFSQHAARDQFRSNAAPSAMTNLLTAAQNVNSTNQQPLPQYEESSDRTPCVTLTELQDILMRCATDNQF